MRESEVRAVLDILFEIRDNRILREGFERMLYLTTQDIDISFLIHVFKQLVNIIEETEAPTVQIGLEQEMQFTMIDLEKGK